MLAAAAQQRGFARAKALKRDAPYPNYGKIEGLVQLKPFQVIIKEGSGSATPRPVRKKIQGELCLQENDPLTLESKMAS